MAAVDVAARLVLVSDLHLDAPPASGRRDGAGAFAAFLASDVLRDAPSSGRLVLLGDTFELLGATSAIRRIEQIVAAHRGLFAALGECLERGWHVDLVPGNHDMALSQLPVQRRLAELLAGAADRRVHIHPWLYHLPGVLYAEHGHHRHALNRFPTVLAPADPRHRDRMFVPPLGAWQGRMSVRVLRSFADSYRAERAARRPGYRALIKAEAQRAGLPQDLVADLHAMSRFRISTTGFRLARRAMSRNAEMVPDGYLVSAAARIHHLLSEAGRGVPVYAFGHTHSARTVPLAGDAWYANTGNWSADVRGVGPDRDDPRLFPYLELGVPAAESDADAAPVIRYWRYR